MWVISVQSSQGVAQTLLEALESFSDSVSIQEDQTDQSIWHLQALTSIKPSKDLIATFINEISNQERVIITVEELPEKDWVAENQNTFTPLTVGSFYIHDSLHRDHLPQGKICLQIDASTAFGTGHHGTTQGCLEALEFLHKEGGKFKSIIDIGTGTGILAIACAKLFGLPVIATDNDAEAILKASENIRVNDCESHVSVFQADGLTHPNLLIHQPFDLVIANILANTLIELSPSIAQVTQQGSILILSGLLKDQAESVLSAFRVYGFHLTKEIIHDDWATLILSSNLIEFNKK